MKSDEMLQHYHNIAKNLQINRPKIRGELALAAYFYTLTDIACSINSLYEKNGTTCVPILFRSFIEAYVDLCNLANDKEYGNRLQATSTKEWLRLLNSCENKNNPFLEGVFDDPEWLKFIENKKIEYEKNNQHKPLKQYEKFDIAGQGQAYKSFYNDLCSDSHNNLRSVWSRFLATDDQSNLSKMEMCMDSVIQMVQEAASLLNKSGIVVEMFDTNEY